MGDSEWASMPQPGSSHERSKQMSPTYMRLLGNKMVSAKVPTPNIKKIVAEDRIAGFTQEAAQTFKLSLEEAKKYVTETTPGKRWLENRMFLEANKQPETVVEKSFQTRKPDRPSNDVPKQQNVRYEQGPSSYRPGEFSGYNELVSKLLNASKTRTPELSERSRQTVEQASQTGQDLKQRIAEIEQSERESRELEKYSRDANARAMRALLSAQKRGKAVTDEDLLGHDYQSLNKQFESPQLQRRQERIQSGEKVAPETYLDVRTVEKIREHNEAIQKDIDAQKALTEAKKKQTEKLEQEKRDSAFEKKFQEEHQQTEERLRRLDELSSPREGLLGHVETWLDKHLGHSETERGQLNRQVVSQVGRTFFPREWSRGSQVWDFLKYVSPKAASGGGSGGGSVPPSDSNPAPSSESDRTKQLLNTLTSIGKKTTPTSSVIRSVGEKAANAATMRAIPGVVAAGGIALGGATVVAAGYIMSLGTAAKMAAEDLQKYGKILPRTRAAQQIADFNLQMARFRRGQERFGNGQSMDELLAQRVQINARWQNASDRMSAAYNTSTYQFTNWLSSALTGVYDNFSIVTANAIKSTADGSTAALALIRGDLQTFTDRLKTIIERGLLKEENNQAPLLWLSELDRILSDDDGVGQDLQPWRGVGRKVKNINTDTSDKTGLTVTRNPAKVPRLGGGF